MKVNSITVVSMGSADIIYLNTDLPNPIWPFPGNATLKLESAPSHTKEFLRENFPNVTCKFVDAKQIMKRIVNFIKSLFVVKPIEIKVISDDEAIRRDWEAVGDDFRKVLDMFRDKEKILKND